jgi:membrane protease YdiL (CAAX protease family)
MVAHTTERAGGVREWPPSFDGRPSTPVAVVLALLVLLFATNAVVDWLVPADAAPTTTRLVAIPFDVLEIGLAWGALRHEGASLGDVGLDRSLLGPALGAFAALVVATNAAAVALAVLGDGRVTPGFVATDPPVVALVNVTSLYLFAAFAEELAVRGYLQNRLVAAFGGRTHARGTVLGIVVASATFAAIHLPALVLDGTPLASELPFLALLFGTGLAFGTIYELTRNLYLVTLVHGFGNYALLVVDPGTWPNWPVVAVLYALLVVGYRRWAARTRRDTHGI